MTMEKMERDFRVEAYPTAPGDFGFASMSGIYWRPGEERQAAEELLEEARQHLTRARGMRNYILLRWETVWVCSKCGYESRTKDECPECRELEEVKP